MDVSTRRQNVGSSPTKAAVVHNLRDLISIHKGDLKKGVVPLCLTPEVLLILNHGFEHLTDTRNADSKIYRDLTYIQQAINSTQYLRLSHGGSTTIQAPVDLNTFHQLSQLDIKRIPPHWIVGLNKFQDKLVLIRMSRSINFLEDLLGKASGEAELCLPWSKLRKLYLSNNFIRELDESLKLLPCLEVLDISQNYLAHTDHYLQYLTEMVHLNLAYNSLSVVPSFAAVTHKALKTLVLRANHLEHINGIELLECLEILDLTSNVLCDHGILIPLSSISTLKQLYLDDNPLSYNARHRILTCAALHKTTVLQLSLDGERFSEAEIKLASAQRAEHPSPAGSSNAAADGHRKPVNKTRKVKSNVVSEISEIPQPGDDASTPDVSLDVVDSAPSSLGSVATDGAPPPAKSRIETLREEFGDSWLQSCNGAHAPPPRHVYSQADKALPADNRMVVEASTSAQPITEAVADVASNTTDAQSRFISSEESADTNTNLDEPDSKYGSVIDGEENPLMVDSHVDSGQGSNSDSDESTYSIYDKDHSDAEQGDPEPFIVKLTSIDAEEFLITITRKQIIEKNIEGVITEMLDLSALLSVSPVQQDGKQMVKCKFDYFRKDRRERCYVMEDLNDSMKLVDILEPVVAESQSTRSSVETLECLKCGKQFVIKNNLKKGVKIDCIHCGSDMVIELSSVLNSQSTPCGSHNTSPSTSPGNAKSKADYIRKSSINSNTSGNSLYLSAAEDGFSTSPPNGTLPEDRTRSGTDATDSTIAGGTDQSPTFSVGGDSSDNEEGDDGGIQEHEANDSVPVVSGTPDSISYRSLSIDSMSDNSGAIDDQPQAQHQIDSLTGFRFDPTDLAYIDHRLKLHLTVTHFDENEQPECVVRCKCVEYTKPEEYPSLLLLTSTHFYVFRIHTPLSRRLDVGAQLQCIERRPLSDICYIEIGLAHQNVRIEFDKSGYCLLLRDFDLGKLLHTSLSMMMSNNAFNEQSKLKSISKIQQEYFHHISLCLPDVSRSVDGLMVTANYRAAFKLLDNSTLCNLDTLDGCQPVSLLVDDTSLYILKETYHLPFTRKRFPKKHAYFHLESTIPIGDISHLDVHKQRYEVEIEGFEENSSEFKHKLAFVSPASLLNFIDLLKLPWKELYDIDLEINYIMD